MTFTLPVCHQAIPSGGHASTPGATLKMPAGRGGAARDAGSADGRAAVAALGAGAGTRRCPLPLLPPSRSRRRARAEPTPPCPRRRASSSAAPSVSAPGTDAAGRGPPVLQARPGCGGRSAGRGGKGMGGEERGAIAVGAAKIPGRLLLTAGPRGRSGPGAAPVSRPARGCGGVKARPGLRGCLPGGSGQGGFGVWRGVGWQLCRAPVSSAPGEGLGVGTSLHGIIHYRPQNSQEPGNILGVCARSWACPSLRCLLSGSGIKAPLAAGAWRGERNSPPRQPRPGWGVWLLSLFGCWKLAGHRKELCNDGWENEISPFREGRASIEPCHASVCAQDGTGAIKGLGICSCVSVREEAEALRG